MTKNRNRKVVQKDLAKDNIDHFFELLEKRFYPDFDTKYVKNIKDIAKSFNIRLSREEKLKFCNRCNIFWNSETREIRLNAKLGAKEYICRNCGHVRRFRYR